MRENDSYPNIRRVGAYAFFAWLAFWSGAPFYAGLKWLGVPREVVSIVGYSVAFSTFMALRDMTARRMHSRE